MAQIIDNPRSATPIQPAANESAPDLKQAIDRLQCAISDTHNDIHLRISPDHANIFTLGHVFVLPDGSNEDITRFIESLNMISAQIADKAA